MGQSAFSFTDQQAHADVCRQKHKGNRESEAANRMAEKTKITVGGMVFRWFVQQGAAGGTAEECEVALGMRRSSASARIAELKADGWLLDTRQRRNTSSGCEAAVLRAASKAEHDAVKEEKRTQMNADEKGRA